ncbi:DNA topoisomerase IV, alpha subunit [Macrolepiota fuliginosa MF-IS2]|uniref:DNA topoisomerase (ATP-hydrolyzing) n=1 Tax=Macrolepiota fuliginosa MF-IS2 TaxID=1400762 RepID=A0A9P5X5N6_9AGAR|nr:DNA topoisomerase IV, alpha subunit [Macrolepiota fuliginosa MF-IS2]
MDNIENLVLSFLTQLVDGSTPPDTSENLSAQQRRAKSKIQLQLANRATGSSKTLTYPKKCPTGSARPLAQLLRVLDLAHEAIIEDMPMTKRDMFYNDVQLFKSQRTVDTLVDDLAATFDLDRSSLNIRASSKGLICGSGLTIHLISGETIQATDTEGALIPVGEDIDSFSLDEDVGWVLIVEKEAVFQTLCRLCITHHVDIPGRGLLITGKGYPDIATRHLVKTLSDCLPSEVPIAALVDADPYGLDILSVYNYGSKALQHENERLAAGGRIEWLGIWSSEFSKLGIDKDKLLPISKADEKKALAMLGRSKDILPSKWKKELVHMLFNRRKAEIEILATVNASEASCLLDHDQEKDINVDVDMRSSIATADMSDPGPGAMSMMMDTDSDDGDDQQLRQGKRGCWRSHEGPGMPVFLRAL